MLAIPYNLEVAETVIIAQADGLSRTTLRASILEKMKDQFRVLSYGFTIFAIGLPCLAKSRFAALNTFVAIPAIVLSRKIFQQRFWYLGLLGGWCLSGGVDLKELIWQARVLPEQPL